MQFVGGAAVIFEIARREPTSARACDIGLPVSRASAFENSSWRSEISADIFINRRPRSVAVSLPPRALECAGAARTAASISLALPRGIVS